MEPKFEIGEQVFSIRYKKIVPMVGHFHLSDALIYAIEIEIIYKNASFVTYSYERECDLIKLTDSNSETLKALYGRQE